MKKQKTYHFNREEVVPHDIFFAKHYDFNGNPSNHYFYCIYSQVEDEKSDLDRFIIGLLITTKEQDGYAQKVIINGKEAYVCCDTEFKFVSNVKRVKHKNINVTRKEMRNVMRCYEKFVETKQKQLRRELNTR